MEQRICNRMPILDHELKWREREVENQRKGERFDSLLCVCQCEIVVCDTGEDLIQDPQENGAPREKGERERGYVVWCCVEEGSKERP